METIEADNVHFIYEIWEETTSISHRVLQSSGTCHQINICSAGLPVQTQNNGTWLTAYVNTQLHRRWKVGISGHIMTSFMPTNVTVSWRYKRNTTYISYVFNYHGCFPLYKNLMSAHVPTVHHLIEWSQQGDSPITQISGINNLINTIQFTVTTFRLFLLVQVQIPSMVIVCLFEFCICHTSSSKVLLLTVRLKIK